MINTKPWTINYCLPVGGKDRILHSTTFNPPEGTPIGSLEALDVLREAADSGKPPGPIPNGAYARIADAYGVVIAELPVS